MGKCSSLTPSPVVAWLVNVHATAASATTQQTLNDCKYNGQHNSPHENKGHNAEDEHHGKKHSFKNPVNRQEGPTQSPADERHNPITRAL